MYEPRSNAQTMQLAGIDDAKRLVLRVFAGLLHEPALASEVVVP